MSRSPPKTHGASKGKSPRPIQDSAKLTVSTSRRISSPASTSSSQVKTLVAKGYTARALNPAKNYDVISFARTMNDDFGQRVKKLFDPEREAAMQAIKTGIYIGWRCPDFKHDCQRIGDSGKCFCGHSLFEHYPYNARSVKVPCTRGCPCKAFSWVPSRPEEVGEFWHQRRRSFDPSTWRTKCKCKHSHEEHNPNGSRRCKMRGCGCGSFTSSSVCAACDRHWEQHETIFETAQDRKKCGLPIGEEYFPFAEIPSLRNMVLTGEDDGNMSYMAINPGPYAAGPSEMLLNTHSLAYPSPRSSISGFQEVRPKPSIKPSSSGSGKDLGKLTRKESGTGSMY